MGGVDWINLAQDRDKPQVFCENGNEPSGSIKCEELFQSLKNY
jgi:hypothetical protein